MDKIKRILGSTIFHNLMWASLWVIMFLVGFFSISCSELDKLYHQEQEQQEVENGVRNRPSDGDGIRDRYRGVDYPTGSLPVPEQIESPQVEEPVVESIPWTPLVPATESIPWTPLVPATESIPWTPLVPATPTPGKIRLDRIKQRTEEIREYLERAKVLALKYADSLLSYNMVGIEALAEQNKWEQELLLVEELLEEKERLFDEAETLKAGRPIQWFRDNFHSGVNAFKLKFRSFQIKEQNKRRSVYSNTNIGGFRRNSAQFNRPVPNGRYSAGCSISEGREAHFEDFIYYILQTMSLNSRCDLLSMQEKMNAFITIHTRQHRNAVSYARLTRERYIPYVDAVIDYFEKKLLWREDLIAWCENNLVACGEADYSIITYSTVIRQESEVFVEVQSDYKAYSNNVDYLTFYGRRPTTFLREIPRSDYLSSMNFYIDKKIAVEDVSLYAPRIAVLKRPYGSTVDDETMWWEHRDSSGRLVYTVTN